MKRLIRLYVDGVSKEAKAAFGGKSDSVSGCKSLTHGCGVLFNWRSFWVGCHYSKRDMRLCINLVPCLTFWWVKPGGVLP